MPWTKDDFPDSMKNLSPDVREKAISIANALMEEPGYDETRAVNIAISRARQLLGEKGKMGVRQE